MRSGATAHLRIQRFRLKVDEIRIGGVTWTVIEVLTPVGVLFRPVHARASGPQPIHYISFVGVAVNDVSIVVAVGILARIRVSTPLPNAEPVGLVPRVELSPISSASLVCEDTSALSELLAFEFVAVKPDRQRPSSRHAGTFWFASAFPNSDPPGQNGARNMRPTIGHG